MILIETEREVRVGLRINLSETVKIAGKHFRERGYEIEESLIIRNEGKDEKSAIVIVDIKEYRVFRDGGRKQLHLSEEPYLHASFEIKKILERDNKEKTTKYTYVIYPLKVIVTGNEGKLGLREEVPINIENPEEIYRSLEEIIACVRNNNKNLKCAWDLDNIIRKLIIKPIDESGLCKADLYCGRLTDAYWKTKNI